LLQDSKGEDFRVKSIGQGWFLAIAGIIALTIHVKIDKLVDKGWVSQGTIACQPYDMFWIALSRRLVEPVQYVLQIAAKTIYLQPPAQGLDGVVLRIKTGGDHESIYPSATQDSFNLSLKHGTAQYGPEHLPRKAARGHASLKDCKYHGYLRLRSLSWFSSA
jgi:hypothetical protein